MLFENRGNELSYTILFWRGAKLFTEIPLFWGKLESLTIGICPKYVLQQSR